ncbi:uncharacterized protein BDW70DRAFT_154649 [Aspergillus foveolatus]|uniref:uncharacterized protein n=1 Tax=Aspergillus foveolatus TaxID=210207 RepID=UPI003CCCB619
MTSIAVTVATKSSLFEQAHPPSIPVTSAQWKSALCEIKLLYIQRQYKRCVARSSSILAEAREPVNPIYKIYLHFYNAICYEAMGLYAHEYSSKKVPVLHKTLDCPDDDPFLSDLNSEEVFGSEDYNSIHRSDGETPKPELKPELEHLLVPSPLQVRKSKSSTPVLILPLSFHHCNGMESTLETQQSHLRAKAACASEVYPEPHPLPIFLHSLPINMGPNLTAAVNSTDDYFRESAYAYYPVRNATFRSRSTSTINYSHEYYSNLTFLHAQIRNTIIHLQALIQDVTAAQNAHNTSRRSVSGGLQRSSSFWSFSPIKNKEEDMNECNPSTRQLPAFQQRTSIHSSCFRRESIRDRIARLRAQGWKTVGLKNPERGWKGADYYRGFCEMVLDELYLG